MICTAQQTFPRENFNGLGNAQTDTCSDPLFAAPQLQERLEELSRSASLVCCTAEGKAPSEAEVTQQFGLRAKKLATSSQMSYSKRLFDLEHIPMMKMPQGGVGLPPMYQPACRCPER